MRKKAVPNIFDANGSINYRLDFFIQLLYDFCCHERSYLIRLLTDECEISSKYKNQLENLLGIQDCSVAYWDIDYAIDWLYAALFVSQTESDGSIYNNSNGLIKCNNEDVDILIALRSREKIDLVLVEVKVEKPYSILQLNSKVNRLQKIFGNNGDNFQYIQPHWILASPNKSKRVNTDNWPTWMKIDNTDYLWHEMRKNFHSLKITRCDDHGILSKEGSYWKLEGRKGTKLDIQLTLSQKDYILQNSFISDQLKLPLQLASSNQFTLASTSYSVPDLITIINAISKEAKQICDTDREEKLLELHDQLSDKLYNQGVIYDDIDADSEKDI